MHEPPPDADALTAAAHELLMVFHGMPRQVPPTPARDLTLGQVRLLFTLRREGPLPMGRVADMFDLSSTAATGFVARVERHRLVERRHRSDDRRVVECALTEEGRRFVDELSGVRIETVRNALSVLDGDDLATLRAVLGRIGHGQAAPA